MPNTFYSLQVHLVFATHGRQPWIADDWRDALWAYMGGICRHRGAVALAVGGVTDHAHTLLGFKPTHRLCDLVREIKGGASEWVHTVPQAPWFDWQDGYAAFSVSASQVPAVRRYIEQQAEHHRRVSAREELAALLRRHGLAFDERHIR